MKRIIDENNEMAGGKNYGCKNNGDNVCTLFIFYEHAVYKHARLQNAYILSIL